MNAHFYQSASYVPPGGSKAENKRRQDQWDEYQQQQWGQRASTSDIPEDSHNQSPPISRQRADSLQPASNTSRLHRSADASHTEHNHPAGTCAHLRSLHDCDRPRRYSSADYNNAFSPKLSPSYPQSEVKRLSGNFNAPTQVELERDREHRKSMKGVEKLRSKVREWVKT